MIEAAAIAKAVLAIIGIGWAVAAALKKRADKKRAQTNETVHDDLKHKMTDEEREEAQDALNDSINS
jgi:hypothetical protein